MTDHAWRDLVVGDRMAVDQEFAPRVAESGFTRQEWGVLMTAVEFEVEDPDGSEPRLVADTSKVPQVLPEVEKTRERMNAMGGAGGGPGGASGSGGGGLLGSLARKLGFGSGGGVDEDRLEMAEQLAGEYAELFQARLEAQGKWADVCEAAAASGES